MHTFDVYLTFRESRVSSSGYGCGMWGMHTPKGNKGSGGGKRGGGGGGVSGKFPGIFREFPEISTGTYK